VNVVDQDVPLRASEVAKILGCTTDYVYKIKREGRLPYLPKGRNCLFIYRDVLDYRESLVEGRSP
jgi:excisionase family DNA binding protein